MTQQNSPRDPRRAPRPAPARAAAVRPARGAEPSAPETPAALPEPTVEQRLRLRRLVRSALIGVVLVQSVVLFFVLTPTARAEWPVFDFLSRQAIQAASRSADRIAGATRDRLTALRGIAERNNDPLPSGESRYAQRDDVPAVTRVPMRRSRMNGRTIGEGAITSITLSDTNAVRKLREAVPGAYRWTNYTSERLQSSEMALMTLRGGVQALTEFNKDIEDGRRLEDISRSARNAKSDRALQQLQIQAQVEVARQLHALRAQQALQTNLYAVTESHRVGLDARQFAQDNAADCGVLGSALAEFAQFSGSLSDCRDSRATPPITRRTP